MNDVTVKISLYQNLFQISLILSVVCLSIAIVLFFVLDIRFTLGYLTGRSAKRQIKELETANAVSGRLISKGNSMQYVAQEMKNDMGVRQAVKPGVRKVEHAVEHAETANINRITEELSKPEENITELFQVSDENESMETEFFRQSEDETSLLKENETITAKLNREKIIKGKFLIERELVLIHTEEVI